MKLEHVLVRADRGQPLDRIVVEVSGGVIYAANPALFDHVLSGETVGVGFPKPDVFLYDPSLFAGLTRQWNERGETAEEDWCEAELYQP
jgi:hypothetical protein